MYRSALPARRLNNSSICAWLFGFAAMELCVSSVSAIRFYLTNRGSGSTFHFLGRRLLGLLHSVDRDANRVWSDGQRGSNRARRERHSQKQSDGLSLFHSAGSKDSKKAIGSPQFCEHEIVFRNFVAFTVL